MRKRIGFIFGGERGLYWRLSGIDNLRYFASEKLRSLPFADAISVEDQGQKQILLIQTSRGALGVVIAFTWGVVLMGLDLSNTSLPALTLTILITTVSTCGLGLLMGCLALITVNVMFVNNFVYFILLIFSGANIPLAQLPSWIQTISHLLPLTRGIMAAREIVAGASLGDVALLLAGELGIGIVYFMMGYVLFAIFEDVAKRRGTLEVF